VHATRLARTCPALTTPPGSRPPQLPARSRRQTRYDHGGWRPCAARRATSRSPR